MKAGSKSNLISAYCALFTVAAGMLIYDYVRRTAEKGQAQVSQEKAQPNLIADAGKPATQPVH